MTAPRIITARERRLLYVVTDDWYFASHRLSVAIAAAAAGYRVAVATREQAHGSVIRDAGCELFPVEWRRRGTTLRHELGTLASLSHVFSTYRPHVIHNVALRPVVYGSLVARRVPDALVINAIAGRGYAFTSSELRARLIRPALRAAIHIALRRARTKVILQNAEDRELIKGTRPDRTGAVTIIRGAGVDTRRFDESPFPSGSLVVMLAARMLRNKGVEEFVLAATQLRAEFPAVRFVLVGDTDPGNYAAVSPDELREWRDSGAVEWWGRRDDMAAVLALSHIVCLPSTSGEGVPKILIEAASKGRPLITTDVPGCREIVQNGVNGILIPPNNVGELVRAIRALLGNAELRATMGHAGRLLVAKEFALEHVVAATLDLYRE